MKKKTLAIVSLITLSLFAFSVLAQEKQLDWAFPRAGMETKSIAGKTAYHLGNEFYAIQSEMSGFRTAIIVLPTKLEVLIDNVNKSKAGAISDRDQFIVGIAAGKAIITPKERDNEYIGNGIVQGVKLYFYKTANGTYVGGAVSKDRTFVLLIPAPDPNSKK